MNTKNIKNIKSDLINRWKSEEDMERKQTSGTIKIDSNLLSMENNAKNLRNSEPQNVFTRKLLNQVKCL